MSINRFYIGLFFADNGIRKKSNVDNELEVLQTEITKNDLKIIEQLVSIAEGNSSQVLEAKTAMGWRAFQDILSIELSPSLTTTNYNSPDDPEERESSFYLGISIDPIKLISTFERKPILKSRWQEAKQQKRLSVIQHYLAYIQARQATKIAAYRMQNLTNNERIASLNSSKISVEKVNNLSNPEYVAAATQMLNTNAQEQIALEELAACVGLSTPAIITILNGK
ncbi:hypothetical protein [Trichormus variabilis]|uniref:Uncharacterized protein n=1 Tax=Trichormus variabilis SAG 1403-4b TaxID=447716 RepID=A0A3S1CVI4_ANAVA|nr:hypothetical protein [Trichormus variabilis]RUS99025.1 hypothetical protein DSM107003_10440 [Trichormus variabilis SAG 1403-4b]